MRSPSRPALSVRRLAWLGMAFGMTTFLALLRIAGPTAADTPAAPMLPSNVLLQRARNPIQLTVLTDLAKVVGWVSGVWDYEGKEITVRMEVQIPVHAEPLHVPFKRWSGLARNEPGNCSRTSHRGRR
jgi:hypothetical protein